MRKNRNKHKSPFYYHTQGVWNGLMNLLNQEITHKVFGKGDVIDQDDSFITIEFDEEVKKFVYPDAFGTFITLKDQDTAESLKKVISELEIEKEALEKKREEERELKILEQQRKDMLKNNKIHESSQVVFWLGEEEQQNVFTEWEVFTGEIQSGKNKGKPNKPARLRPNSASLLTVRDEDEDETERQIVGIYMVDETFTDKLDEDGMVQAHTEFRIELTEEEAEKMPFWNYYLNKNHPHRTTWNSGKYRYYDNIWTAQILQDIISLKTDEEEVKLAENFLDYFCKMNAIDKDNIPEANGALKQ